MQKMLNAIKAQLNILQLTVNPTCEALSQGFWRTLLVKIERSKREDFVNFYRNKHEWACKLFGLSNEKVKEILVFSFKEAPRIIPNSPSKSLYSLSRKNQIFSSTSREHSKSPKFYSLFAINKQFPQSTSRVSSAFVRHNWNMNNFNVFHSLSASPTPAPFSDLSCLRSRFAAFSNGKRFFLCASRLVGGTRRRNLITGRRLR